MNWESILDFESQLRNYMSPERYKLLWSLRFYLETLHIELDQVACKSFLLKKFCRQRMKIEDMFEIINRVSTRRLFDEDKEAIIACIYYLIIYPPIEVQQRNLFVQTIRNGLVKLIKSEALEFATPFYAEKQEKLVEDILHEFSESLFV